MRWDDERYVRVYLRDSVGLIMMPWQARPVLWEVLRKLDRAGVLDLGEYGPAALPTVLRLPADVTEAGLSALLERRTLVIVGTHLVMPNYIDAQECTQSDKVRKAEQRARARDKALASEMGLPVTIRDQESRNVTSGHDTGQIVTRGHERSHGVTAGHSVPYRAEPNLAVPADAGAHVGVGAQSSPVVPPEEPSGERRRQVVEPEPASADHAAVIAELRKHRAFSTLDHSHIADVAVGKMITNGFKLEWVIASIIECNEKNGGSNLGMSAQAIQHAVIGFIGRSKPAGASANGKPAPHVIKQKTFKEEPARKPQGPASQDVIAKLESLTSTIGKPIPNMPRPTPATLTGSGIAAEADPAILAKARADRTRLAEAFPDASAQGGEALPRALQG